MIVRRERPHPGAQLSFTDHDGHRFQAFLTDQPATDLARAGAAPPRPRPRRGPHPRRQGHRPANLPFGRLRHNAVWLELVLIGPRPDLLDPGAARSTASSRSAEPKTLRYRLLHVAGRLTRHARRVTLRLQRTWPWAAALAKAFARLPAATSTS